MVEQKESIIGKKAKDIALKDHNGEEFRLSHYRGRKVLLSFHPLAWTPICADQMKALEKNWKEFDKLNTVAVGLSVDSIPSKAAWAKQLRIKKTPLLADFWPHGLAAKAFGILRKEGFSERANFVVDEKGKVIFAKIYPIKQLPDLEEIMDVLRKA
ncbi:MAG: redoxin domain-containing protein [Syntrophales bacterium]|nr:redoxin domain-containing protein [Syntrophales bacterium]